MSQFNRSRKESADSEQIVRIETIIVMGSGCKKCRALLDATKDATASLGIDAPVEYVADMARIAKAGVMNTPALIVNDEIVVSGATPKTQRIREILLKRAGRA